MRVKKFDQAYTCVKITMKSQDFIYKSIEEKSQIVPLRATGSFNKISIEWYRRDDESNLNGANAANTEISTSGDLPTKNNWNANSPQLMRVQLINPGSTFNLAALDSTWCQLLSYDRTFLRSDVASQNGTAVSGRISDHPTRN